MLNNYDYNIRWGVHEVEVYFQQFSFKGVMRFKIDGNCRGLEVLPRSGSDILDEMDNAEYNKMSIKLCDDSWLGVVTLTDDNGDTCEFDVQNESDFESMVVGMRIVNFEERVLV